MKKPVRMITVCAACHRASCWLGYMHCEDYRTAGTRKMPINELSALKLEHSSYWNAKGKSADISWLHSPGLMPGATWSPWHGCSKVHTGCLNCWAEAQDAHYSPIYAHPEGQTKKERGRVLGGQHWGKGKPRRVTAESGWKHPLAWAREAARAGKRMLVSPLNCDPLDPEVYEREEDEHEEIASSTTFGWFMHLIKTTGDMPKLPGLIWLLLTKRPENWARIPEPVRRFCWLIYSASDQPTLEDGMAHLRYAQGFAGLGLSLEPLVGPIDMDPTTCHDCGGHEEVVGDDGATPFCPEHATEMGSPGWLDTLDWVIIGGESGPKARPCHVEWIRDLLRQCREAGTTPFVKQLGKRRSYGPAVLVDGDDAATDPALWPEDLRVQEWPEGLR